MELSQSRIAAQRLRYSASQGNPDSARPETALIEAERLAINDRYRRGQLKDEARRRLERELDLREACLTDLSADE